MELLKLTNVTRTYVTDNKEHHALYQFSYTFPDKGLVAIIGKSGSGKSTLLNLIALLDKPTSGVVYFDNQDINQWSEKRRREYHYQDIGIIFQHYHLVENESALYNIMLPMLIKGEKESKAKEKATKMLNEISFNKELYNQKAFNLSGGEKERIAVLRALINDPRIILADEPTGALDSRNSSLMLDVLKRISETRLVIVVSHNISLIKKYTNHIIVLKDGVIQKGKKSL